MASFRSRRPKHFAIRLSARIVPVGAPARVYLVCSAGKPVAAVVGGQTGEDELAAAGFALCPVEWDLMVEYSEIRQALALLPHVAKKGSRR